MFLLDAHVDTITRLMEKEQELYDNDGHLSLKHLEGFKSAVIIFAIFLHKEKNKDIGLFKKFNEVYDFLKKQIKINSSTVSLAKSARHIEQLAARYKVVAVPAIEEGAILEGRMDNLYKADEMGIRYITLTWNFPNEIGEPSKLNGGGLTLFGKDVLREMNKLGVFADVSHLSEAGFWDVYKLSDKPFIASHSNAKALCNHHRNLTDDQLRAIGEKNGCVGVNFCNAFLTEWETSDKPSGANIDDVCRQVDHMLKMAGEDCVGIGSDFDGITETPAGLENASKLHVLYDTFKVRYGNDLSDKIFYHNFMRVLNNNI